MHMKLKNLDVSSVYLVLNKYVLITVDSRSCNLKISLNFKK